jgi:ABC-type bacteriocin/lantibiotic exporter with double-glycine peptidase domain
MEEARKKLIYEIRKEKLKLRMPLVVLILITFLIYHLWLPLVILKWVALAVLILYLGAGFYFQKKLRNELDKLDNDAESGDESSA